MYIKGLKCNQFEIFTDAIGKLENPDMSALLLIRPIIKTKIRMVPSQHKVAA